MYCSHYCRLDSFEVTSGVLIVSDPCYSLGTSGQGELTNVRNGTWRSGVLRGKTDWGVRCWEVLASHRDYPLSMISFKESANFEVGVDSGQAGIFDKSNYNKGLPGEPCRTAWYEAVCALTLDTELWAGTLTGGVVSSSGFGDGCYRCYLAKDGEQMIIGVKIIFISDEDFV